MARKFGVVVAAVVAMMVVFAGAQTYAGGGKYKSATKTASAKSQCPATCSDACKAACQGKSASSTGLHTMAGGTMVTADNKGQSSTATTANQPGSCRSHGAKPGSWASVLCGTKGYYAANVFEVRDGHPFAVYGGSRFEVTDHTPYMRIGDARYYFPDPSAEVACKEAMDKCANSIDRETVSLATLDGNVVGEENGHKMAQCIVTGNKFLVTADAQVRVADGKRYYFAAGSLSTSTTSNAPN